MYIVYNIAQNVHEYFYYLVGDKIIDSTFFE